MKTDKVLHCLAAVVAVGWLALQPQTALAGEEDSSGADRDVSGTMKHIRGVAVTGVNSVLGKPLFSWGAPFGASFNFPTLGVFNPQGTDPTPLDSNTPESAVLASWLDPTFLALLGKPPSYVVNPAWVNVPLRKVPINVSISLDSKMALPGVRAAGPIDLAQAEPSNDITVGQWMRGGGVATIHCAGERATLELQMRNLIPNRLYSVWGFMGAPAPPGAQFPAGFPIPIGGTPNFFTTDKRGDATFERWIKFCPLDAQSPTGTPLLFIDVHFNAIDQTWGAVVTPGFIDGNWPGFITFSHVVFPVNVELLNHNP